MRSTHAAVFAASCCALVVALGASGCRTPRFDEPERQEHRTCDPRELSRPPTPPDPQAYLDQELFDDELALYEKPECTLPPLHGDDPTLRSDRENREGCDALARKAKKAPVEACRRACLAGARVETAMRRFGAMRWGLEALGRLDTATSTCPIATWHLVEGNARTLWECAGGGHLPADMRVEISFTRTDPKEPKRPPHLEKATVIGPLFPGGEEYELALYDEDVGCGYTSRGVHQERPAPRPR